MPDANSQAEQSLTVNEFVGDAPAQLRLRVLAGWRGAGTQQLTSPRIHKLGLALAGFTTYVHAGRLQLVGQSEISFLGQLDSAGRRAAIRQLDIGRICCVLVTGGLEPPAELAEAADEAGVPLLGTPLLSSATIAVVTEFLQERLAPRCVRHGVMLDVYGLGVLIEGASGIGKSECALDLIARGHRLVADDAVEVRRISAERLQGRAPELLREHLEIRGLGIINVRDVFGISAVSPAKAVELSIKLERWDDAADVERLGIDSRAVEILGVSLPHVLIPVSPGRNLATLVETAVRVEMLRRAGVEAAQKLVARHTELLIAAAGGAPESDGSDAIVTGELQ